MIFEIGSNKMDIKYDEKNDYTFTIIITNNSDNIEITLNSIINQSISFIENTQIILLNNTKLIKEYVEKYPKNILLLNSNDISLAIKKASGKYLSILKDGESFSRNILEETNIIFEKYFEEIDLIKINRTSIKNHSSKIIDLNNENYPYPIENYPYFVKTDKIQDILKNDNKYTDIIFDKILLGKKKIVIINETYPTSYKLNDDIIIKNNVTSSDELLEIIKYSLDTFGNVPSFIQYNVISNLQESLKNENNNSINNNDLRSILKDIDNKILINNNILEPDIKNYLIHMKNKEFPISLKDSENPDYKNYFQNIASFNKIFINSSKLIENNLEINGYYKTPFNVDNVKLTANNNIHQILEENLMLNINKKEEGINPEYHYYDFEMNIPLENKDEIISLNLDLLEDDFHLNICPKLVCTDDNQRISKNCLIIYNENSITLKTFKYTIILRFVKSIYDYRKTIDSIINQKVNFEKDVQIITVCDETNNKILDEIHKLKNTYPNNVFINKTDEETINLKNILGNLVSFLDCGDTFSESCFESIEEYYVKDNNSILKIPLKDNNRKRKFSNNHNLYYKNSSLNNSNNYNYLQTELISTFIPASLFDEDSQITVKNNYEDIILINELISKADNIIFIDDCFYKKNMNEIIDYLKYLKTVEKLSTNPYISSKEYKDNLMLFEINKLIYYSYSEDFEYTDEYKEKISDLIQDISTDTINNNEYLNKNLKTYLLYLKNNQENEFTIENNTLLMNIDEYQENISNNQEILINSIKIDQKCLEISASFFSYLENCSVELSKIVDGKVKNIKCEQENCDKNNIEYLNTTWKYNKIIKVTVPIENYEEFYCYFNVNINDEKVNYSYKPSLIFIDDLKEDSKIINDKKAVLLNNAYLKISNAFNFSIVIAIYNTEAYLNETVDSIINQTLDFKENVQLILVDDGSEDNSLEICKEYQKSYPRNIIVFSQENSGQATARNNGLKYAKGKYVNFLDSDDYLSEETLENVLEFFDKHEHEIDIVAIPIKFFGRNENYHILNKKFNTSRVIDLRVEPNNPQLSASSAFFKNELFPRYKFATDIITSEDSVMINEILLEKQKYGVINSATYYYRKRFDESSTIDSSKLKKEFFIDKLDKYFDKLEQYSYSKTGKVEKFVQYLIAYDIQWLLKQPDLSLLNDTEKEEFWNKLMPIVRKLDVDVVNNEFITNNQFKNFFTYLITGKKEEKIEKNNAVIKVNNKQIDSFKSHRLWIDIVEMKNGFLNISGFLNSNFNYDNIKIFAEKTDLKNKTLEEFEGNRVEYPTRQDMKFVDCIWQYNYNFDLKVPLDDDDRCSVRIIARYLPEDNNNIISSYLKINFHKHARISNISNYIAKDSHLLTFSDNAFHIEGYRFKKMRERESVVEERIKKSNVNGYKSAIYLRKIFLILHFLNVRFLHKQIYLFMDRTNKADDNAEHLFKYAVQQDDGIKKYFILEKDSKDYKRLSKIGNVVAYKSLKHKLLYLLAHKVIGSHPDESLLNPFYDDDRNKDVRHLYNGLITSDIYFLQHGVTKDNIAYYLRKYDKNLSLIVTVSDEEKESFTDGKYTYDNNIVQTLGFPRYDNLKNDNKKKRILIIPTWRNFLEGNEKLFTSSEYFHALNNIVSDKKLIDLAKEKGYEIIFKPHPRLEYIIPNTDKRYLDLFEFDDYVTISYDETYPELFESGSLLITDYSSVFFDFAYLKKPIIYYHYADDYHHEQSYFDYETMGFGDEIKTHDDLINKIEEYLSNDCIMENRYIERVDSFFKYNDKNNCKRVYDWIVKH